MRMSSSDPELGEHSKAFVRRDGNVCIPRCWPLQACISCHVPATRRAMKRLEALHAVNGFVGDGCLHDRYERCKATLRP